MIRVKPNPQIAIDIGGANLKFVASDGSHGTEAFPMWTQFDTLESRLNQLMDRHVGTRHSHSGASDGIDLKQPDVDVLVTITGELADNFRSRREGVCRIVEVVRRVTNSFNVYTLDGFKSAEDVLANPIIAAAANWHATAMWLAIVVDRPSLLIDIGSTTTDLVPVSADGVHTTSRTDGERLSEGTLLYVGDRRTSIMSIVDALPLRSRVTKAVHMVPIMREHFATTDDVRILMEQTPCSIDDDTADGRSRELESAARRMLRMVGTDLDDHDIDDAIAMADAVATRITDQIRERVARFRPYADRIIFAGVATEWLPGDSTPINKFVDPRFRHAVDRCAPCVAMLELWNR